MIRRRDYLDDPVFIADERRRWRCVLGAEESTLYGMKCCWNGGEEIFIRASVARTLTTRGDARSDSGGASTGSSYISVTS
jgi:hypothetical protein